jgi:hypothetical protein
MGVAVDAAHVFWTDSNQDTIGGARLDGTGIDRRFITGLDFPEGMAVDALRSFSFGKPKCNEKKERHGSW